MMRPVLNRDVFAALRLEDVGNAINYPDYLYPRRPVLLSPTLPFVRD